MVLQWLWVLRLCQSKKTFDKYFTSYPNDEAAIAGEAALVASGALWEDPVFPANGESMYKDPFKPPRGTWSLTVRHAPPWCALCDRVLGELVFFQIVVCPAG